MEQQLSWAALRCAEAERRRNIFYSLYVKKKKKKKKKKKRAKNVNL